MLGPIVRHKRNSSADDVRTSMHVLFPSGCTISIFGYSESSYQNSEDDIVAV